MRVSYTYFVEEIKRIAPEAVRAICVKDGRSLLLLTCTDWDFIQRRYMKRLLVRAVLAVETDIPGIDDTPALP